MDSIFQKFTGHSKNALKNAFGFALASGHKTITPQHILYGLSLQKGSIAFQILNKAKIKDAEIKKSLEQAHQKFSSLTQVYLSDNAKKLLEKSVLIASLNNHRYIGTEHLLASLLEISDQLTNQWLVTKGINRLNIQQQVNNVLKSTSKFPDLADSLNYLDQASGVEVPGLNNPAASRTAILDVFGTELTDQKIQSNIDPLIGRQDEIERLIQILSRRTKNNPLLLGDPGVGKTAIVEGLAKQIALGQVPNFLADKKIYALDLSLIVAGTSFRGEFENRLKQIINEAKTNPAIILFIDEIHNLIGTGGASGSMDAANILKPSLARGEIRCIGATTIEEYKKNIETDPALERRFQSIVVTEPSVAETIAILEGIKSNYELFHQVKISADALVAAAELSERYISDRFLPDKAIDLIDEACSAAKIKNSANPLNKKIGLLENQLKKITNDKNQAVTQENYATALKYRDQEQQLINQLKDLKEKNLQFKHQSLPQITANEISQIVSKATGIPAVKLVTAEKTKLLNLEKTIAQKIISQPSAVGAVAEFVRRSKTGINDANRPIGSFIFLGPSGVGKTELAKVLAQTVFGSSKSLIKIDMSEFAESFNMSKLIGAPAGYIGYRESAKLTDAVKKRPYSVVLLDEIEKAHPQIFNLLLQILEDGVLTDATGKSINFKNTIIIMTSNLGSEKFNHQAALGFNDKIGGQNLKTNFEEIKHEVLKKLQTKFPPEFLSRIDRTIVFEPLNKSALTKITNRQIQELQQRLAKQKIKLTWEPALVKYLANKSYDPQTGARLVKKNIQDLVENQLAETILNSKTNRQKITIKVRNDKITI
ncbi:MAG: ATP-dependent Clp protease ATP-binding subunit [Patescibacteria group bacterium]|jgi:ATP-dependent Clp protease ATP-binding subunit ClpC|nr:ATP-dependent Clp protease ATP-binding subunit [Patescibacteria group bacterium]